jgi:hypothetical protein
MKQYGLPCDPSSSSSSSSSSTSPDVIVSCCVGYSVIPLRTPGACSVNNTKKSWMTPTKIRTPTTILQQKRKTYYRIPTRFLQDTMRSCLVHAVKYIVCGSRSMKT